MDRNFRGLTLPVRRSNLYAIYRIDHELSRTHSWLVTIQRRSRVYHRHFSDRLHGGKRQALEAAKAYRDRLASQLQPLTRKEVCSIRKKNNRSRVPGVVALMYGRKAGGCYIAAFTGMCSGRPSMAKPAIRSFPSKYGERGAFLRALRARREALQALSSDEVHLDASRLPPKARTTSAD